MTKATPGQGRPSWGPPRCRSLRCRRTRGGSAGGFCEKTPPRDLVGRLPTHDRLALSRTRCPWRCGEWRLCGEATLPQRGEERQGERREILIASSRNDADRSTRLMAGAMRSGCANGENYHEPTGKALEFLAKTISITSSAIASSRSEILKGRANLAVLRLTTRLRI